MSLGTWLVHRLARLESLDTDRFRRTWLVGDLHGRYQALGRLLDEHRVDPALDLVVSAGDLIDRGENSPACLAQFLQGGFRAVPGNHELMALGALIRLANNPPSAERFVEHWLLNGGDWFFRLGDNDKITVFKQLLQVLTWPLALLLQRHGRQVLVLHAQVPGNSLDGLRQADAVTAFNTCLWARDKWLSRDTTEIHGVDAVVVGHTPVRAPTWLGNTLYLDTGAALAEHMPTLRCLDDILDEAKQSPNCTAASCR